MKFIVHNTVFGRIADAYTPENNDILAWVISNQHQYLSLAESNLRTAINSFSLSSTGEHYLFHMLFNTQILALLIFNIQMLL
jgi:hypothetical protein